MEKIVKFQSEAEAAFVLRAQELYREIEGTAAAAAPKQMIDDTEAAVREKGFKLLRDLMQEHVNAQIRENEKRSKKECPECKKTMRKQTLKKKI